MNTNRNVEKIRRRKLLLKHIETKSSPASRGKQKYWLWFGIPVALALLGSVLFLTLAYTGQLSRELSNYENLMLPTAFFAAILLILILWFFPKIYIRSLQTKPPGKDQSEFDREKEKLKLEDETRKTLAQIIAGAVVLIGLAVTFYTYKLNVEKQDLDREQQMTDRFSKAIEHLGDEKLSIRLGGLYELERIAKDSPKDHPSVMEVLASYLREKKPFVIDDSKVIKKGGIIEIETKIKNYKSLTEKETKFALPNDLQVALMIIGRRNVENDQVDQRINLSNTNLCKANLSKLNLSRVNFSDSNLYMANFRESKFFDTSLYRTILFGSNFIDADISRSNFSNADMSNTRFGGAHLSDSDLSYSHLTLATFNNATFSNIDVFDTDFFLADFSNANLEESIYDERLAKGIKMALLNEETKLPARLLNRKSEFLENSNKNRETLLQINKATYSKVRIKTNQ